MENGDGNGDNMDVIHPREREEHGKAEHVHRRTGLQDAGRYPRRKALARCLWVSGSPS